MTDMTDILNLGKRLGRELAPLAAIALVIFAGRSTLADWNMVPTGSMKPTILEGDTIFVDKLAYDLKVPFTTVQLAKWADPERGDIVVFYAPHNDMRMVKRVVGLPGDTVAMHHNQLVINGQTVNYDPLPENAAAGIKPDERRVSLFANEQLGDMQHKVMFKPREDLHSTFNAITVPAGQYLMLGDNRDNSADSRYFGFVPRERILGRAKRVLLSLDQDNYYQPRFERFTQPLQ